MRELWAVPAAVCVRFVRCVAPNREARPDRHDNAAIRAHLRADSTRDAVRLLREGFLMRVHCARLRERLGLGLAALALEAEALHDHRFAALAAAAAGVADGDWALDSCGARARTA